MNRRLTITAAAWASQDAQGRLWLVGERDDEWTWLPPAEFVQACAPCETCHDTTGSNVQHGEFTRWDLGTCPSCRIELVGVCPTCSGDTSAEDHPCAKSQRDGQHCNCSWENDICHWCGLEWLGDGEVSCPTCPGGIGTVTLGHAYAVGEPLLLHDWPGMGISPGMLKALAHAGPVEWLVGKWALRLEVVGS